MDTLSWGRLGAKATGVDFSDKLLTLARNLSKKQASIQTLSAPIFKASSGLE